MEKKSKEKVLKLQQLQGNDGGDLASNLSFICKLDSTISYFLCNPDPIE